MIKNNKYLISLGLVLLQVAVIFLLYYSLQEYVGGYQSDIHLELPGFLIEFIGLFLIFLCCLIITNNLIFSFLISNTLYLLFVAVSLVKFSYLKVPIVYYDFFQLYDLLLNLDSIDTFVLVAVLSLLCIIAVVFFYAAKKGKGNHYRLISSVTLLLFVVILSSTPQGVKKYLSSQKIKYKWNSNIYEKTQKFGLLTFFIQSAYFSSKLEKPSHYSLKLANEYLSDHSQKGQDVFEHPRATPDNVIVLLIESYQNVKELPWKTNIEVTPIFNQLESSGLSGNLISPVFGGKSINAEFELLTGFSNVFNPVGSIPYKDFIHHNIPSIARQFKQHNYTTNAIQVVEMKGYGYGSIYEHLGFDHKFSLSRFDQSIELDPTKRYGSSEEISAKIGELISHQDKSFIFAFPNSSHAPWKIKDYPNNKVKLLSSDLSNEHNNEIIAYYNAMIHIDELFKSLTNQLNSSEKTIILIVGDHQPALKAKRETPLKNWTFEEKVQQHTVPYLFWANYDVNFPDSNELFTSMNFIGLTLMKIANIKPKGFYAFLNEVKKQYQAFTFVLLDDNKSFDIKDMQNNEWVKKYQAVQYKYLSNDAD